MQEQVHGFRLSPQQRHVWLLRQRDESYWCQCALKLVGTLNMAALEAAVGRVVALHEVLRTRLVTRAGLKIPIQVVSDALPPTWRRHDLGDRGGEEQAIDALLESEARAAFDPAQDAPLRVALASLGVGVEGRDEHLLVLSLPSLHADARTLSNLVQQIATFYSGGAADDEPVQYVQFSEWQNEVLDEDEEPAPARYGDAAEDSNGAARLPFERGANDEVAGLGSVGFELEPSRLHEVRRLCRKYGKSLPDFLQATWQTVVHRLSGASEVTVSRLFDGRDDEELAGVLGPLAKALPLVTRFDADLRFTGLLDRLSAASEEAAEWQDAFVPDHGVAEHDPADLPIGFDFQTWPEVSWNGLSASLVRWRARVERYKLAFIACEVGGRLLGRLEYDAGIFHRRDVEGLARHLLSLTTSVSELPGAAVGALEILDPDQRHYLLHELNRTDLELPAVAGVHQLFESQVERHPDRPAVRWEDRELTYRQLDRQANRLAHALRAQGVGPDVVVGIQLERSLDMIVALVAVMKAGGAYVPLDPHQPPARQEAILEDCRPALILTHGALADTLPPAWLAAAGRLLRLDADAERIAGQPARCPENLVDGGNLAYVIFTSGSTGRPKGVAVEHRQLLNYLHGIRQRFDDMGVDPSASFATVSTLVADLGNTAIFPALIGGGTLHVIAEERTTDPIALASYCKRWPIDGLKIVPSHLEALLASPEPAAVLPRKLLVVGGEACHWSLLERIRQLAPECQVLNHYGPTETTVGVSVYKPPAGAAALDAVALDTGAGTVPIGRPLANSRFYPVSLRLQPVPRGMAGELLVGGSGLARGYLGRPAVTAERFVPDPFSTRTGGRLYRTGDRTRYLEDGDLEFLGRCDDQIKIRGFRIEPGEVAGVLRQHPEVRECVCTVHRDARDQASLVGYVVPPSVEIDELREFLRRRLPEYMVPSAFVPLKALPLNANGKVDSQALPAPETVTEEAAETEVLSPFEELLCRIFREVLGVPRVGPRQDFFDLGGHSLLATQVISRVRQSFQVELPVRALFEAPTVAALAVRVEEALKADQGMAALPLTRRPRDREPPLSYAQQRLWFLNQFEPDSPSYNSTRALRFVGQLSIPLLEKTFTEVVRRHEALRTTFPMVGEQGVQRVAPPQPVRVPLIDLSGLPEDRRDREAGRQIDEASQRPYDLTRDAVFRFRLLRLGEDDHALLIAVHHVVSDAWSVSVLVRESAALYEAFYHSRPSPLPPLAIQYADFALWQRQWLDGEVLDKQLDFWRGQLAGSPGFLELPTDRPRPAVRSYRGDGCELRFSPQLSAGIEALSQRHGLTLFMTLMAAFQTVLYRYSGQSDVSVGTPIAGRNRLELESLIGFFVNMLVIRRDLSGDPRFVEVLEGMRELVLEAYTHQDLPFELLVEELQPERNLTHNPFFQVAFAFQNVPSDPVIELPGVELQPLGVHGRTAKFDMILFMHPGKRLSGFVEFSSDIFDRSTIRRMLQHFESLLSSAVANGEQRLTELSLLPPAQRHQMLVEWNDTRAPVSGDTLMHDLFEARVAEAPLAIAVCTAHGETLTYEQLNRRANRVAHRLRSAGIARGSLVGVYLRRTPEMVVAVLGVLKAGAAYVPLDAGLPRARVAWMLRALESRCLLTQRDLLVTLSDQELPELRAAICLDGDVGSAEIDALPDHEVIGRAELADQPSTNPERINVPEDRAYVIFTSGSTGTPKGVVERHLPAVNLIRWVNERFDVGPADRVLFVTSLGFDLSVYDIFGLLAAGGSIRVAMEEEVQDPERLVECLLDEPITFWDTAPAALLQLTSFFPAPGTHDPSLRLVFLSGDWVPLTLPERVRASFPGSQVIALGGATEATVWSNFFTTSEVPSHWVSVPYGRPIDNAQYHVLDQRLQPCPIGVPGDLHIGDLCLATGYLNEPRLTAGKFLPDPYSGLEGGTLYRTGDRARFWPGGLIEFLGRVDHQVKLRGFRVELGEVAVALTSHDAVVDAVALVREDTPGDQRLVAYLVADPEHRLPDEVAGGAADHEQVSGWEALFDETYTEPAEPVDPRFNIAGWNSSYTGEPIPAAEMLDWVEQTVARIRATGPRRMLEIGCGTGLLLFRLAPECELYQGMDFSASALAYLKHHTRRLELDSVVLKQRFADDFRGVEAGSFDTVVINSVVQYFPSAEYLLRVLEEAVDAVESGGVIFVGDVRHHALLEAFQTSVEMAHSDAALATDQLRRRVLERASEEEELVIHPGFFFALARHRPRIRRVEVRPKRGRDDNELTRFRYDVILHVGDETTAEEAEGPTSWDWHEEGLTLEILEQRLRDGAPQRLAISGVPNDRVHRDVTARDVLATAEGLGTVASLERHLERELRDEPALAPEDLWELADRVPYAVELSWADGRRDGALQVLLERRGDSEGSPVSFQAPVAEVPSQRWSAFTNNPLRGRFARRIIPVLRQFLHDRLPDYMVPSAFVLLDSLPVTPNGKLDRGALPEPKLSRQDLEQDYAAPETQTEETLAAIWGEVLGLEQVGIHDDFFDLGGHSLLATQVVSRLREAAEVEVPVRRLFESPTVAELAAFIDGERRRLRQPTSLPLVPVPRDQDLPLSFAQERLWFLDQLEPGTPGYNIPLAQRLRGSLALGALERALNEILRRHESLRTCFPNQEGVPLQVILPFRPQPLTVIDLSGLPEAARERQIARWTAFEASRSFDLSAGPLMRFLVLRAVDGGEDAEHTVLLTMHHIVSDGWSIGVFTRELAALYSAFLGQRSSPLPELAIQYADFAGWQRSRLSGEVLEAQIDYWRRQLDGAPPQLALLTDRPRPAVQTFRGARVYGSLEGDVSRRLKDLAREARASDFMTLLTALYVLLHRYTDQDDLAVGTYIANRNRAETESLIGFFVNTLALRVDVGGDPGFRSLLETVRDATQGAYEHQDIPFEKLLEELQLERDLSHTPIFQVLMVYQNTPDSSLELPGLKIVPQASDKAGRANFDLTFWVMEQPHGLGVAINYNRDLFDASTMEKMVERFAKLVEAAVHDPECPIPRLPLVADGERQQLVGDWSHTAPALEVRTPVHRLFEERATETPGALALVSEGGEMTYGDLNARANRIAHTLRKLGVGPESRVGMCLERSSDMLAAALAILKAGGAYVPVDAHIPAGRLAFLAEDTGMAVLVTHRSLVETAPAGVRCLWLDESRAALAAESAENPDVAGLSMDHPAYVIYTSGSTGKPKGVEIRHGSLAHYTEVAAAGFEIEATDRVLQFAAITFDAAVEEIYPCLTRGATLVLRNDAMLTSPWDFVAQCEAWGVTVLDLPTAYWHQLVAAAAEEDLELPAGARLVILGGEKASVEDLRVWRRGVGDRIRLVNTYGPTEATVVATRCDLTAAAGVPVRRAPIGRPIAGARTYVFDRRFELAAPGIPGELVLAGPGLARGYCTRPALTARSLVPDPFGETAGERLYRTGDRVRFLADGELEFLGRIDHQVKLRGFRIEPGEVEAALRAHSEVRQAAVTVHAWRREGSTTTEQQLVAYVVFHGDEVPSGELRRALREQLPDFMIPSLFQPLSELPVTTAGKLDRRALPAPDQLRQDLEQEIVAADGPVEEELVEIWSEVLGRRRLGVQDNFFELGGHSLLATQVIARIRDHFEVEIPLIRIFEMPTIEELALVVEEAVIDRLEELEDDGFGD